MSQITVIKGLQKKAFFDTLHAHFSRRFVQQWKSCQTTHFFTNLFSKGDRAHAHTRWTLRFLVSLIQQWNYGYQYAQCQGKYSLTLCLAQTGFHEIEH